MVDPVGAEFLEDARQIAGRFAVQVAGAADQRPAAIHHGEHFLRLLAQPFVLPAVLRPHAAEAVVELRVLQRGQVFLRRAAGYAVLGEALPLDAVQPQVNAVSRPLAEAEQRLLHVRRLTVHLDRDPQAVAVRLVGPPQFWVLPVQICSQHRLATAHVHRCRRPTLLDLARLVINGFQHQGGLFHRRPVALHRDLHAQLLVGHGRFAEHVRRVSRAGGDPLGVPTIPISFWFQTG